MEILRKYATASRVFFPLVTLGSTTLLAGATIATSDIEISKDEGSFGVVGASDLFVEIENGMYYVVVDTADMTCARFTIKVVDQTNPKEWEDQIIIGSTYGHASAEHTDLAGDLLDVDMTDHQTQGTLGQAIGDPAADATTIYQAVATDAAGDNVAVDVVAAKADTAAIKAKTDSLAFTKANEVDANVLSLVGDGTGATQLNRWASTGLRNGTAQSGTTTTLVDTALTHGNTAYVGATIVFGGNGHADNVHHYAHVTGFVAATDTLTFHPAVPQAVTTELYVLIPSGGVDVKRINAATVIGDGNATPWDGA